MLKIIKLKVADVVFRKDLYPRIKTSASTVEEYADDLDVLPRFVVNQKNELIKGWHRWNAHIKNGVEEISAAVVETRSDAELLETAITMSASHGLRLRRRDKREIARRIYEGTAEKNRDQKKKDLQSILSVSKRTILDWLSRIDDGARSAQRKRIFDLWLACYTVDEIAEFTSTSKSEVARIVSQFCHCFALGDTDYEAAEHETDFQTLIYDVGEQKTQSEAWLHLWNSKVRLLDALLYRYTRPLDVVIDPFAGLGSTIDICKMRSRRYLVSDSKPIVWREHEIRQHDPNDGVLMPPHSTDVKLVLLDPPYWIPEEGHYSNDPEDLGNQWLEDFTENLTKMISEYAGELSDAHIALILRPTQWKATDRAFSDHIDDIIRAVDLPVAVRSSILNEPQQYTHMLVSAKDNKTSAVLTHEVIVWKVDQEITGTIHCSNPNSPFAAWLRKQEELRSYRIE